MAERAKKVFSKVITVTVPSALFLGKVEAARQQN